MRFPERAIDDLAVAWQRYTNLFGEPPHGTKQQLAALLELVPAATDDNEGDTFPCRTCGAELQNDHRGLCSFCGNRP